LIRDLKARGLLDGTLVVWGGEFGRTVCAQGKLTRENYGRDHHDRCFTMWMAGGGVQHGRTDGSSYNVVQHPRSYSRPECHDSPVPGGSVTKR